VRLRLCNVCGCVTSHWRPVCQCWWRLSAHSVLTGALPSVTSATAVCWSAVGTCGVSSMRRASASAQALSFGAPFTVSAAETIRAED
jgi:hypothetical protein